LEIPLIAEEETHHVLGEKSHDFPDLEAFPF